MSQYTPRTLYEHAFAMSFDWDKHLDETVYRYHELTRRQMNTPVELQMGTVLPFIAACAGPRTRGLFFTDPSVLNLFWLNIAASGVGKSQSRKKYISEPLEYIIQNSNINIQDFEVCNFTRAGKSSFIGFYMHFVISIYKALYGPFSIVLIHEKYSMCGFKK